VGISTAAEHMLWVDSPEQMARFHSEFGRVDLISAWMARLIGRRAATFEDLQEFARQGLLDAARSFDEQESVPFAHWAAVRMRQAIVRGVRQMGRLSRAVRRRLRTLEAASRGGRKDRDTSRRRHRVGTGEDVIRLDEADASLRATRTPEDLLAAAELGAVLREIVRDLPLRERHLVEAVYFGGQTLENVAARLGRDKFWAIRVREAAFRKLRGEFRRRRMDARPLVGSAGSGITWRGQDDIRRAEK
jgi:RNA polymerase sigma factor (sigma-70 family)